MNRIGDNLVHFGANEAVVRALLDAGAKYVVVGGLAVAWHCAERQADDMDLMIDPTLENSATISKALAQLGLTGFTLESFARPGLQVPLKQNYYAELLTPEPGLSYAEVETTAVSAKLFGLPVLVASVDALLQMKRRAVAAAEGQRLKHEADIALLERLPGGIRSPQTWNQ
jgi:hypothetical protein